MQHAAQPSCCVGRWGNDHNVRHCARQNAGVTGPTVAATLLGRYSPEKNFDATVTPAMINL